VGCYANIWSITGWDACDSRSVFFYQMYFARPSSLHVVQSRHIKLKWLRLMTSWS